MNAIRLVCFSVLLLVAHLPQAAPVLLISIDGLHPAYVLEADRHGLRIPNLRRFVSEGAYARGVIAAVPTVTYPNHTTMVTGATPAEHGIVSNTTFDPLHQNREGWYWYAEDIRVPTLWKAAHSAGLSTLSVNWPVTVGATDIDFLLPEFWRASTSEDLKLLRALSRPAGLQASIEKSLGMAFVDGYTDTIASDATRTKFSLDLIRRQKPGFMAVHLVALDGTEHKQGPFLPEAFATLEQLDAMVGELSSAMLARDAATVVAIVSDHGFIATHTMVNLRTRFVSAGLIELDNATTVKDWQAQVWSGGATAAIVLRDRTNEAVRTRVTTLLEELRADHRNGIARVLNAAQIGALGSFPEADFLVEFAPGFYLGTALQGELLVPGTSKGTHGYLAERPEMHAAFFIKGAPIAARKDLGIIDMRQIAPTLAAVLGVPLPTAKLRPVPVMREHE